MALLGKIKVLSILRKLKENTPLWFGFTMTVERKLGYNERINLNKQSLIFG